MTARGTRSLHLPRSLRQGHRLALFAAVLAIIGVSALAAHLGPRTSSQAVDWTETEWRMPLDNWGQGRAWRVTSPGGAGTTLYARTKTGFCNCFSGIADDTEIDRIGDVDLHGDNFVPAGPGAVTSVGELAGRKRLFLTSGRWSGSQHVLSIVAASDCKAVVATLVSAEAISTDVEASAVALLTDETFRRWAAAQ